MTDCTRGRVEEPLNIKEYGAVALELKAPKRAKSTGFSAAVIGGGLGGLSAAWQLGLKGHSVDLYEAGSKIGGKLEMCIPRERLPKEILDKELSRFAEIGVNVNVKTTVDRKRFEKIYKDHDVVVVAVGAHEGRVIPFPGHEDVVKGIDYLKEINFGKPKDLKGAKVVVIGAGNVGMDIACQAWDHGAGSVTCVDMAKDLGLLGRNILGTDFNFQISRFQGSGAFVCGEETALIQSIAGLRGMPQHRPP